MIDIINTINDAVWGYFLMWVLVACGIWFTIRTKGVQFRMFGEMLRLLFDSATTSKHKKHISSFQAFAVSLASRVGTGNLAGVATAIAVGGPGAVFWMWVMALFGAATSFVESTLAQLFKVRSTDSFVGGPAYYIRKGMNSKWMAVLFALLMVLTFGLTNNSVQTHTICSAMEKAFGWNHILVGAILTALALVIVFGGIQRIAHFSSIVVPFMALGYLILTLVIIFRNIELIPQVFSIIIDDAFGIRQVAGGGVGIAIMQGVRRGLFSNEAGEGSAPNAAATADVTHPVKQGLIQALGVFTDTLLVCSCTAFIIIISGLYTSGSNGVELTQIALQAEIGNSGPVFIAVAIFLFAFSSVIGNYYYGEANIRYMTNSRVAMTVYRLFSGGVMVMFGALTTLNTVWSLVDICMALLTICNLVAITYLGKYTFRLLDDYRSQRKQGKKDPVFHRSQFPEIQNSIDVWE